MKSTLTCVITLVAAAGFAGAQSPKETESKTIAGKKIAIQYSAPRVNNRAGKIFGDGNLVSHDPTYPAWRAGANDATALHTDAELDLPGLKVPPGDYTLYVWVKDPNAWELIVNKQTGQFGTEYDASKDLGRVKMTMSKPPAPIENLKYTLTDAGGNKGKLQLEWENHIAAVTFTAK